MKRLKPPPSTRPHGAAIATAITPPAAAHVVAGEVTLRPARPPSGTSIPRARPNNADRDAAIASRSSDSADEFILHTAPVGSATGGAGKPPRPCALMGALGARGMRGARMQPSARGTCSHHLDGWLTDQRLGAQKLRAPPRGPSPSGRIMGLFDGTGPKTATKGSSAEISKVARGSHLAGDRHIGDGGSGGGAAGGFSHFDPRGLAGPLI